MSLFWTQKSSGIRSIIEFSLVLGTFLRHQVDEVMEVAWGSWGMLGGKGFEALVLWCMEEVRSNVAVRRAGSPNQISQLPAFDKSGEGPLAAQRPHAA